MKDLLNNPAVIRWCYEGITEISLRNTTNDKKLASARKIEKKWGNKLVGKVNSSQWTNTFCQNIVKEALIRQGNENVRNASGKECSLSIKKYCPDLECDNFVYEIKGRNWCTPGTAGEKILGVPLKYGELPNLYSKPLKIILVGYQEYEARKKFAFGDLFDENNQTKTLKKSLTFFKEQKIEYIGLTEILNSIGFPDKYWERIDE